MKRLTHIMFSTLTAGVLLGLSSSVSAGGMSDDSRWSGDLRYSAYHIAAENDAMRADTSMSSGQAGRAGPESLPMGKTTDDMAAWQNDLRYSVYHIAADYDAAKASGAMSGQAGRAGPETLPGGRIEAVNASDIRFSIYDDTGRTSW
ncbi:MAG: hypothetical protein J0M28_12110 [Thauera sp.]|nr:hypothetical protein [Thauera sp.]